VGDEQQADEISVALGRHPIELFRPHVPTSVWNPEPADPALPACGTVLRVLRGLEAQTVAERPYDYVMY
jgi:hypothetical protein